MCIVCTMKHVQYINIDVQLCSYQMLCLNAKSAKHKLYLLTLFLPYFVTSPIHVYIYTGT